MKPLNVLVTGGAGYIGSHTAKALARAGHVPVVLDDLSAGHKWAVKWGPLVQGSIADQDLVDRTIVQYGIDAVIHLAAFAYVGESMVNPQKYFANNIASTLSLLDALLKRQIRLVVFSSSCATYGKPVQLPMDEEHPQVPVNPYGESKLFVEKVFKWYDCAYDLRSVILTYFNACGADPGLELGELHVPETHVIPLVLEACISGTRPFKIFGTDYPTHDGTCIRDFIHVTDLAEGHVSALQYLADAGRSDSFNLGTGVGQSVRQVIQAAEQITGHSVAYEEGSRRDGDLASLVAAAGKARSMLGWHPTISDLRTILQTSWDWRNSGVPTNRSALAEPLPTLTQ